MKFKTITAILTACALTAFWSCGNNGDSHEGHDHDHHTEENHEGHDHDHEGHDHDHEGHDHEGHDHGAEGADKEHMPHEEDVAFSKARAASTGIKTETVNKGVFSQVIKTSGKVMSASGDEQIICAPASGIVKFNNPSLTAGMTVSAGQSLFSISSRGMADADGTASLRAELENAERALERVKKQYEERSATLAELHDAEARVNSARAAMNSYSNRAATSAVGASSPMSGYLVSLDVAPGQYVTAGQQLASVALQKRMKVQANLSERYFPQAATISGANIIVPANPGTVISLADHNGRVTGRGRVSDNGHTMPIFLEFDNPGQIANGSYVEVYLLAAPRGNVISVPKEALVEEQGLFYVFVKEGPEQYHKTVVKTGASDGARVEIVEGLHGGEQVVTKGATQLKLESNAGSVPAHSHNH